METPTLANVLHNIADHTDTLLRFLKEDGLDPEFVKRMENHIYLEEKENSVALKQLSDHSDEPILQKLLDHSYFIQKMIKDQSIARDLRIELLDHFMEEHQEWQTEHKADFGFTEAKAQVQKSEDVKSDGAHHEGFSKGWTVGPMWGQGDVDSV